MAEGAVEGKVNGGGVALKAGKGAGGIKVLRKSLCQHFGGLGEGRGGGVGSARGMVGVVAVAGGDGGGWVAGP